MNEPIAIDLRPIARSLRISYRQVEAVAQLLEEGKSAPFIARYRKDQTGGLEEEQIRRIGRLLHQARLLAQRKQTILDSLQLQGKWTPELDRQIRSATTSRRLEDLYLPYKPKKEGLAATARARGLEPLAEEILQAAPTCANLEARAADFVNPDKQVRTPADALLGAGHILAEMISEHADLRKKLREVFYRTGIICSRLLETVPLPPGWTPAKKVSAPPAPTGGAEPPAQQNPPDVSSQQPGGQPGPSGSAEQSMSENSVPTDTPAEAGAASSALPEQPRLEGSSESFEKPVGLSDGGVGNEPPVAETGPSSPADQTSDDSQSRASNLSEHEEVSSGSGGPVGGDSPSENPASSQEHPSADSNNNGSSELSAQGVEQSVPKDVSEQTVEEGQTPDSSPALASPPGDVIAPTPSEEKTEPPAATRAHSLSPAELRAQQKELKKQRELQRRLRLYRNFFDFQEPLRKISPYRILTLNRAERQKILRVWIQADREAMRQVLYQECIPPEHPHADFLRGCADDALDRLLLPSLEREARRELTERAEAHAVEVVAKSLRKMLLQRPLRAKRILAVDPGLRNGYVVVALDEFGNLLEHAKLYLIGRSQDREGARQKLLQLIRRYRIGLVAIGSGVGSRIFEEFLAPLIDEELKTEDIRYGVVSDIGARVYARSAVGQEEFPYYEVRVRSAISIGRRLLDPLSELVKIPVCHLATGTYQHDVQAKHLQPLLEEVVQSCVNRVGVDVNTAHPWLLRYVSGLNMVLARRIEEYRRQHGPFRCRTDLKQIPGFGEGTFELAAGFLKILQGSEPLDRTGIHPDCYPLARKILEKVSAQPEDLWNPALASGVQKRLGQLDSQTLAQELGAGVWTVRQVLSELRRAGRDIREDSPLPSFKRARLKPEDLKPEMELSGTVVHIADFGAFVDIGVGENGLVHISQMAAHYVRDPRQLVSVGDTVKVWVLQVDLERRRISLSMIPPDQRAEAAQAALRSRSEKAPLARAPRPALDRPSKASAPTADQAAASTPAPRADSARPPAPERKARSSPRQFRSKAPPPPAPKLSEAVKQGKQPMRTFAELLQFFHLTRQQQAAAAAQPTKQPSSPKPPADSSETGPAGAPPAAPPPSSTSPGTLEKPTEQPASPPQTPPSGASPTTPEPSYAHSEEAQAPLPGGSPPAASEQSTPPLPTASPPDAKGPSSDLLKDAGTPGIPSGESSPPGETSSEEKPSPSPGN